MELSEKEKRSFLDYLKFYRVYLGSKIEIGLILNFFVVALDGLGIAMILPLFQLVEEEGNKGKFYDYLVQIFDFLHIPITFLSIIVIITILFVIKGFVKWREGLYALHIQHDLIRKLRLVTIDQLTSVRYEKFATTDAGQIHSTLVGEVVKTASGYALQFRAIRSIVFATVYATLAFISDWKFAFFLVISGGIVGLLFKRANRKTQSMSERITHDSHWYSGLVMEVINTFKYLRSTDKMPEFKNKVEGNIDSLRDYHISLGKIKVFLESIKEPLIIIVVLIVIAFEVIVFEQKFSVILVSLLFFYRSLNFILGFQSSWNDFMAMTGSINSLQQFQEDLMVNKEVESKNQIEGSIESLELINASFSYDDKQNVLDEVSLKIRKYDSVAFVGESGSGKTTLVNVLTRLVDLRTGDYLINGISVKDLDRGAFQSRLGYISQEAIVYDDTIFNNVTFWAERNAENVEKFWNLLRKASIYEFIQGLPEKEETRVGTSGVMLSGGQKQRLSIARELYKDFELLIMDEATSALDSETERIIQNNVDQMKGKVTIITIAHRLSTIVNADVIYYLEKGVIKDFGSFSELKTKNSSFKQLVDLQKL